MSIRPEPALLVLVPGCMPRPSPTSLAFDLVKSLNLRPLSPFHRSVLAAFRGGALEASSSLG